MCIISTGIKNPFTHYACTWRCQKFKSNRQLSAWHADALPTSCPECSYRMWISHGILLQDSHRPGNKQPTRTCTSLQINIMVTFIPFFQLTRWQPTHKSWHLVVYGQPLTLFYVWFLVWHELLDPSITELAAMVDQREAYVSLNVDDLSLAAVLTPTMFKLAKSNAK